MDIELLSKMLRGLILENDVVTLPGLGSFVTTTIPATFSDRGFTINPPYRKLEFMPSESGDTLLADLYASSNSVDQESGKTILKHFLSELREAILAQRTISLPNLGRFRATSDNSIFFITDENADIFPEGFGLQPLSLKNHLAPSIAPKVGHKAIKAAEAVLNDEGYKQTRGSSWWKWLLGIVILAVLLLAAYLLVAYSAPDLLDSILYTPEELRIINY